MSDRNPTDAPAPPPGPPSNRPAPASPTGAEGIYIKWRDRLWQEQPDGSYLVWNEESHQWESSVEQPPRDTRTISTKECPSCGKRVRQRMRSCPYCGFGFPETPVGQVAAPAAQPKRARARRSGASTSGVVRLLVPALLVAALLFGAVVYFTERSRSCDNWKKGVQAVTQTMIRLNGLPRGVTEQELQALNEERYADQRPGGCE